MSPQPFHSIIFIVFVLVSHYGKTFISYRIYITYTYVVRRKQAPVTQLSSTSHHHVLDAQAF